MQRSKVISSAIRSIGWDNGILEIEFAAGNIKQYLNVPLNIYQNLMNAPSVGKFFNEYVKNKY